MKLKDKVAVITGAASLIGMAMALKTDVSSSSDVSQMIQTTVNTFEKIDIPVNNSGVREEPPTPIHEMSEEQ
jgi:NAD(P)-dependent dehydrogenase (short-subunit alcohol dehydrogenase family)